MHESFQGSNQIPAVRGRTFDVISLSVALRAFGTENISHICGFSVDLTGPGPVHQIFAERFAERFVHSSFPLLEKRFE